MATNTPTGDGHRKGMVKGRSQTRTLSGHYVKRDTSTGRFMDVKTSSNSIQGRPKGVMAHRKAPHARSKTAGIFP